MARKKKTSSADPKLPIDVVIGEPSLVIGEGFTCKRYLIFAGRFDDVRGGIHDFHGAKHTITEAMRYIARYIYRQKMNHVPVWEWFQIFDLKRMRIVRRSADQPYKRVSLRANREESTRDGQMRSDS